MTNKAINAIDQAIENLKSIKTDIQAIPDLKTSYTLTELLNAIADIDTHYVDYCAVCQKDYGEDDEDPRATYNSEYGVCMEMEIEAGDWHKVSKLYRKLIQELGVDDVSPNPCPSCGRSCYCCYCELGEEND